MNNIDVSKEKIIRNLKKSEEEIKNGEGINAEEVFKELRAKFGYKTIQNNSYTKSL